MGFRHVESGPLVAAAITPTSRPWGRTNLLTSTKAPLCPISKRRRATAETKDRGVGSLKQRAVGAQRGAPPSDVEHIRRFGDGPPLDEVNEAGMDLPHTPDR